VVSLVGYTNAGKSTLLNALTDAGVLATDKLFATLDPTTRRLVLPGGKELLMTDTVGFIQKLPTELVAAFRATLEEIVEADLLLHVVDITHRNVREHTRAVGEVLEEIGASHKPLLVALNKVDLLGNPEQARQVADQYTNAVAVSALRGQGIADLLTAIERMLVLQMVHVNARIPYAESELLSLLHRYGVVQREQHDPSGILIEGQVPPALLSRFKPYVA
jgi:GTP-binding protein HflX